MRPQARRWRWVRPGPGARRGAGPARGLRSARQPGRAQARKHRLRLAARRRRRRGAHRDAGRGRRARRAHPSGARTGWCSRAARLRARRMADGPPAGPLRHEDMLVDSGACGDGFCMDRGAGTLIFAPGNRPRLDPSKREDVLERAPPALHMCGTCVLERGEETGVSTPAVLALEDGTIFRGVSVGAKGNTTGEVVFNTAITGYQEILTDPSYCRQIVTLTYPHIGNTGTTPEDLESLQIYAAGSSSAICRCCIELARHRIAAAVPEARQGGGDRRHRHPQAHALAAREGRPGRLHHDRRAASMRTPRCAPRKIPGPQGHGSRQGRVDQEDLSVERGHHLEDAPRSPPRPQQRLHVVAYDFGIKRNILRMLADHGCRMTVVPAQTPADRSACAQSRRHFLL